jgi:class 3 adenylate cyclase/tetratricopeptide (TPR) repeat protein
MNCPRCNHQNAAGQKFCGECGARLAASCPACGASNAPEQKFCGECGARLGEGAPPSRFASPHAYTPKHLAERILLSKEALEGERKQVTVLFADLKGSMELLADRDPEEARALLDPVLERMIEAVHRYEGTVNQVMGDGIMALFGAPIAQEDHAVRACYAALRMQEGIRRFGEELFRTRGLPSVQIRVGLNSGEVVVGAIGGDLRMEYTAVGLTTHLAARMEQVALPGTIRLTAETLRAVEGFVQVRALGAIPVKGLEQPVEVYELTGAGAARSRLQAAASRGLTRFVGRQSEIATLTQALQRAGEGHGEVIALVGDPGVGKSRLVWEFIHSHRLERWLVLESASVSYGKASAWRPVIDLLKSYFRIEERDDGRSMREKAAGKLLMLDRKLEPLLTPLLALLEAPLEDPQWDSLDPGQRRLRILDACKGLLLREAQVQPLVLVFEDLHWIDHETQAFLDLFVDSLPAAPILLLVNYRPEYQHRWGVKSYYAQVRVDPLAVESAEELLDALLGKDASLAPLRKLLIERTARNALFLEESVRALVESGVLAGGPGAYQLTRAADSIEVPPTVQAILAARIDRLSPENKQLLQTAAVIGKDVPYPLLEAIAGLPEELLRQRLANLQTAEFLYEASLFPDLEYTFKHALTHEVAYGSVLQERRKLLHQRILEAMEQQYADRVGEHVERLAQHAFRAEVWDRAVQHLRRAAIKALKRAAHREAAAAFEQALAALTHLPAQSGALEQAIDLRLGLRAILHPLGELKRIFDHLQEAETLARALGDQRRLARIDAELTYSFIAAGDYSRAVETTERALALAVATNEISAQLTANNHLFWANNHQGNYRRAVEFSERNVALLGGDLSGVPRGVQIYFSATARTYAAFPLSELGDFAEAISCIEAGLRVAEEGKQAFGRADIGAVTGHLHLRRGNLDEAIRVLEPALELCRSADVRFDLPLVAYRLGSTYALSGRVSEGIRLLEEALEEAVSIGINNYRSQIESCLSEAYLLAGKVGHATDLASRAIERARAQNERGVTAWTLRGLAEIACQKEARDLTSAEAHYRQALALAGELDMRPLIAHCHLGLSKVHASTGRRDLAISTVQIATKQYRDLDMPFWLEKAEETFKAL